MSTSNVKVGDFVAVFSGYGLGRRIVKVEVTKVTSNSFTASGVRYVLRSGRRIGSDSSWATPWTDETARQCERYEAVRSLYRKQRILSREVSWHALTGEQCDSVLALLASFGLDRGAKP